MEFEVEVTCPCCGKTFMTVVDIGPPEPEYNEGYI